MKKCVVVLLIVLQIVVAISCTFTEENIEFTVSRPTFIFPASLVVVEDEAFSNTAAHQIVFQDEIQSIEKEAFAGSAELLDVYIPTSVKYIADSAFDINDSFTVHGVKGSYAHTWALEHRISFVNEDIWTAIPQNSGSFRPKQISVRINNSLFLMVILGSLWHVIVYIRNMRHKERSELNPIDYAFP